MSRSDALTKNQRVLLEEAAEWLLKLDEAPLSHVDQENLHRWRRQSPEHERIWQTACALNRDLSLLPSGIAKPVLQRPRHSRRTLLKCVVGAGLALPIGWFAVDKKTFAQYRTATGERLELTLSDGTEMTLNTATALDTQPGRQIRLYTGEVFIRTGTADRTLSVITAQGAVQAVKSDFTVRCLPQETRVSVIQGSVKAGPRRLTTEQTRWVSRGETCDFTENAIGLIHPLPTNRVAWLRDQLIAEEMPLRELVEELNRYRRGIIHCEETIGDLKVSGVFQLNNPDQALEVLAQLLNLKLTHYTDYWVLLKAA